MQDTINFIATTPKAQELLAVLQAAMVIISFVIHSIPRKKH